MKRALMVSEVAVFFPLLLLCAVPPFSYVSLGRGGRQLLLHWQLRRCCVFPFHPAVSRMKVFWIPQWQVHGRVFHLCRVCRGLASMQLDTILLVVPEMLRSSPCSSSLAAENTVMVRAQRRGTLPATHLEEQTGFLALFHPVHTSVPVQAVYLLMKPSWKLWKVAEMGFCVVEAVAKPDSEAGPSGELLRRSAGNIFEKLYNLGLVFRRSAQIDCAS